MLACFFKDSLLTGRRRAGLLLESVALASGLARIKSETIAVVGAV